MHQGLADAALAGLAPHRDGWRCAVPARAGLFMGRQLTLTITTAHAGGTPPPPVLPQELALARVILENLPTLLPEAERRLAARLDPDRAAADHLVAPQLWISRDRRGWGTPGKWTLVVERDDWADYGYHIEFDGLTWLETWEGD